MKKFTLSSILLGLALSANAQTVYLNETFAGTFTELGDDVLSTFDAGVPSEWACLSKGNYTNSPIRAINSTPLTYNDGNEYILSNVGRTLYCNYPGQASTEYWHVREFSSSLVSGKLYVSFLLNMEKAGGSNSILIAIHNATNTSAGNACSLWQHKSGSGFKLGISDNGAGTASNTTQTSTIYDYNTTYFIVIVIDNDATTDPGAYLYVNPEVGSTPEPISYTAFDQKESSSYTSFKSLYLRGQNNNTVYVNISGIRITDSWDAAVAAKLPAPTVGTASDLLSDGVGFTANWTPSTTDLRADGYDVNVYQETTLAKTVRVSGQTTASAAITDLAEGIYTYEVVATLNDGTYSNSDPALSSPSARSADVVLQATGINASAYSKIEKSVQYNTLTGVAVPATTKGLLLKKTTYSDGSVKIEKVIK
jgi:hypothetical protein